MAYGWRKRKHHLASDSSWMQTELKRSGVCCNLHCRLLAVADGNKLVVASELQSMAKQKVFPLQTVSSANS